MNIGFLEKKRLTETFSTHRTARPHRGNVYDVAPFADVQIRSRGGRRRQQRALEGEPVHHSKQWLRL